MGLLRKKAKKIKRCYDVNAPISEYTEEQIIARITNELGDFAAGQYEKFRSISFDNLTFSYSIFYDDFEVSVIYFANEFFKVAMLRKAKKLLYNSIKKDMENDEARTEDYAKSMLEKINAIVEKYVEDAHKKIERKNNTRLANKQELPKIDALFEEELKK